MNVLCSPRFLLSMVSLIYRIRCSYPGQCGSCVPEGYPSYHPQGYYENQPQVVTSYQSQYSSPNSLVILKASCGMSPADLCRLNGMECVEATSYNKDELIGVMKKHGIKRVYVSGWDGSMRGMVLRDNGNVAPYDPRLNATPYAICIRCPCPSKGSAVGGGVLPVGQPGYSGPEVFYPSSSSGYVSPPAYLGPGVFPYPFPCPPGPRPCPPFLPCPDLPLKEKYVDDCPREIRGTCDVDCRTKIEKSIFREYILDERSPRDRECDVKLKVCELKKSLREDDVLLAPCPEENSVYPNILRFPEALKQIYRCVEEKARAWRPRDQRFPIFPYRPVCLYVGGCNCNELFAFVDGCFYRICIYGEIVCPENLGSLDRINCGCIKLVPVGQRELCELEELGLARISFGSVARGCAPECNPVCR